MTVSNQDLVMAQEDKGVHRKKPLYFLGEYKPSGTELLVEV